MGQLSKAPDSQSSTAPVAKLNKKKTSELATDCQSRLNLNPKAQPFVPTQSMMNEQAADLLMAAAHLDLLTQTLIDQQVGMFLNTFCPTAPWQPHDITEMQWQQPLDTETYLAEPPGLEKLIPEVQRRSRTSSGQADNRKTRADKGTSKFKNSKQRDGARSCDEKNTMKGQLEALRLEDPAKVFIARGINKLGFSSAEILRTYFSRYGEVKGIHVSHSRVKSVQRAPGGEPRSTDAHWRLRAGPLGFIVMSDAEDTARILAEGPEQDVNGVTVRLQPFQGQRLESPEVTQEASTEA